MSAQIRQLLRFLIVGVLNTAVGLGTIFALKGLLGWDDIAANMGGYALGLSVSFLLNRRWTFRHHGAWTQALPRFLAVFAVAYSVNLWVLLTLRDTFGVQSYLAHALAMVVYTVLFFLGSRFIAFRPQYVEANRT